METRRTRGKKLKYDDEFQADIGEVSDTNDPEGQEELRKSKIRDSNKEYAKRMTILQTWTEYWSDYTIREGDAYPKKEALNIIKRAKKIMCPIEGCRKYFTTFGGLRYHYARCKIERCFKCKVCEPATEAKTKGDLLRHMIRSHYKELPVLDDEQKEIASTYLIGHEKAKKRPISADQETQVNCRHTVKSYCDLLEKTFELANYIQRPYKDWRSLPRDWELVTNNSDRRRYLPPERESPQTKTSSSSTWLTLKTGESIILKKGISSNTVSTVSDTDATNTNKLTQSSVIFYTGGISSSAAWLPKPLFDKQAELTSDLLAVSVKCCPMDRTFYYKDCKDFLGCIQFWAMQISTSDGDFSRVSRKPELSFMIGHNWGNIFEMSWCPLGASWERPAQGVANHKEQAYPMARVGLLALACGDGQIRLLSVPHVESLMLEKSSALVQQSVDLIDTIPVFRVKPIACLAPPGAGQSTDHQTPACTSLCWNTEDNQKLLVAGYSNGSVALFDLSNYSPILYSTIDHYHFYRPYKTWFAHGLPVAGVALLSSTAERTIVASGGRDRQLKLWNPMDLNTCLSSDRAPITKLLWDYRFRGIVSSTEAAFTSFQNRVSYRFPAPDGSPTTMTIVTHRATVWGLANSLITSSLATSDEAGEVLVSLYGRPVQKRDRNLLSNHCIFTLLPRAQRPLTSVSSSHLSLLGHQSSSGPLFDQQINCSNSNIASELKPSTEEGLQHAGGAGDMVSATEHINNDQLITTVQTGAELIELDENNEEDVYGVVERQVANKPARFLLPIDHDAVETYSDFKHNFGLEFVDYSTSNQVIGENSTSQDARLPESCARANDVTNIYCDRVCDYPIASIRHVSFSPNVESFAHLLSVSHIGLCRVDRINPIEQTYGAAVGALCNNLVQEYQQRLSAAQVVSNLGCSN